MQKLPVKALRNAVWGRDQASLGTRHLYTHIHTHTTPHTHTHHIPPPPPTHPHTHSEAYCCQVLSQLLHAAVRWEGLGNVQSDCSSILVQWEGLRLWKTKKKHCFLFIKKLSPAKKKKLESDPSHPEPLGSGDHGMEPEPQLTYSLPRPQSVPVR